MGSKWKVLVMEGGRDGGRGGVHFWEETRSWSADSATMEANLEHLAGTQSWQQEPSLMVILVYPSSFRKRSLLRMKV
jgi:hypothetical protein